jgi:hypothetical protein
VQLFTVAPTIQTINAINSFNKYFFVSVNKHVPLSDEMGRKIVEEKQEQQKLANGNSDKVD